MSKAHRLSLLSAACVVIFAVVGAGAFATSVADANAITIWVVGSPHIGDVPNPPAAVRLRKEARSSGYDVSVETFPAREFADVFAAAVARNTAPDLLVFDNFGVITGITTSRGRFEGIGRDPRIRSQLVKVTEAFDELLGPTRGWTYLFTSSPNHLAVRNLALHAPSCIAASATSNPDEQLALAATDAASAYLTGDIINVQTHSDPDRIPPVRLPARATAVGGARVCGVWANDALAFVTVKAAYESHDALGEASILLVFRRVASQWRLLVATRDPISVGKFVTGLPQLFTLMSQESVATTPPMPATLTAPAPGQFPSPREGERFGSFTWRSSPSNQVVAEIAEFVYADDVRLVLTVPLRPAARSEVSAGQLWTTQGEWSWRIWSIGQLGELAFSESRTFVH